MGSTGARDRPPWRRRTLASRPSRGFPGRCGTTACRAGARLSSWTRMQSAPAPSLRPASVQAFECTLAALPAALKSRPFAIIPRSGIAGPIELRTMLHDRFSIDLSVDQVTDLLHFATGIEDAPGLDYLSFVKHVHGGRSGLLWPALRPHLRRVLQNTSVGSADDPMCCTVWHLFAAFDTTRSNWVTHEQLGVGLRELGLPTSSTRLRELCAETMGQRDGSSASAEGFGFGAFCHALGVEDAAGELDRAARWVSRQRHIWDVVNRPDSNADDSDSTSDRGARNNPSPLSIPVAAQGDEHTEEGDTQRTEPSTALYQTQQSAERQQYCSAVRSIAERRALTQSILQALGAHSAPA